VLAAAIVVVGVLGVAGPNQAHLAQPMTIYGHFKGRTVMVTATDRSAGAIESLQWGGTEFLDASDHGRNLQSAVSFDGLGECDNPTEAGSSRDGWRPNASSSRLLTWSAANNVLSTRAQMAYWLRLGQRSAGCTQGMIETRLSSTRLVKTVRFLPGFPNVLEHRISFELARPRALAQFEVLTAYMPEHFDTFYRFNPAGGRMEPLSDGPGEQGLPVVLATSDGTHALGLLTPQAGTGARSGPGYGRWRFKQQRVTKSNVVFRQQNAKAGAHSFVVYTVFGTLEDVRETLRTLHGDGRVAERAPGPSAAKAPMGALAKN